MILEIWSLYGVIRPALVLNKKIKHFQAVDSSYSSPLNGIILIRLSTKTWWGMGGLIVYMILHIAATAFSLQALSELAC